MMSVFVLSCLTFINSLRCELVLVLSLFVCILLCIVFWYSYFFLFFPFFFSSRRRHTRYIGDWSSDVCSSDLVVARVVPVSSTRAAEMAKLLENIFRCVNIAIVNELKQLSLRMNLDIWEVIDAAATKPDRKSVV